MSNSEKQEPPLDLETATALLRELATAAREIRVAFHQQRKQADRDAVQRRNRAIEAILDAVPPLPGEAWVEGIPAVPEERIPASGAIHRGPRKINHKTHADKYGNLCCAEHGIHSIPHRNCILR